MSNHRIEDTRQPREASSRGRAAADRVLSDGVRDEEIGMEALKFYCSPAIALLKLCTRHPAYLGCLLREHYPDHPFVRAAIEAECEQPDPE